jgi:hypothetical protein
MCKIIALCGKKQSGKDTLADYLVNQYGYTRVKIAEKLKLCMTLLFGFTQEQLENAEKDKVDDRWGISPRQAMQFFGTEIMQYKLQELIPSMGRDFFIQSTISDYITKAHSCKIVITDLRFMHEYKALVPYDVYVIHVKRSVVPDATSHHVSEIECDEIPVHHTIMNNGSIKDLHNKLDAMLASVHETN